MRRAKRIEQAVTREVGRGPHALASPHSNSHDARPVHLIIAMIKWIRTRRLSLKNSLPASLNRHVAAPAHACTPPRNATTGRVQPRLTAKASRPPKAWDGRRAWQQRHAGLSRRETVGVPCTRPLATFRGGVQAYARAGSCLWVGNSVRNSDVEGNSDVHYQSPGNAARQVGEQRRRAGTAVTKHGADASAGILGPCSMNMPRALWRS